MTGLPLLLVSTLLTIIVMHLWWLCGFAAVCIMHVGDSLHINKTITLGDMIAKVRHSKEDSFLPWLGPLALIGLLIIGLTAGLGSLTVMILVVLDEEYPSESFTWEDDLYWIIQEKVGHIRLKTRK